MFLPTILAILVALAAAQGEPEDSTGSSSEESSEQQQFSITNIRTIQNESDVASTQQLLKNFKEADYHDDLHSMGDQFDIMGVKNHTKRSTTSEEDMRNRLKNLAATPDIVTTMAAFIEKHTDYLQGENVTRVKRQDVGGLLGGGANGLLDGATNPAGSPPNTDGGLLGGLLGGGNSSGLLGGEGGGLLDGVSNGLLGNLLGLGNNEGLLAGLLGSEGLVGNLVESLLGSDVKQGLLGELLDNTVGKLLGTKVLGNLLKAVTGLLKSVLSLLSKLLGVGVPPGLDSPEITDAHSGLLEVVQELLQFVQELLTGNNTTSTGGEICYNIDCDGNLKQDSNKNQQTSLINISPNIFLDLNILSRVIRTGGSTTAPSALRRICVTPGMEGSITKLVVGDTTIKRDKNGSFSLINVNPTIGINLNLLSKIIDILGKSSSGGIIGGTNNQICVDINSTGTFTPTNSLINISPQITANLNVLSKVVQSGIPNFGHQMPPKRICFVPGSNGELTQIVVNGTPVKNKKPFTLLNLNPNVDLNLNVLSQVMEIIRPGSTGSGGSTGGSTGGSSGNEICFDIPILSPAPTSSGLINVSPNIGINANILSGILKTGGGKQTSAATRRICIPMPTAPSPPATDNDEICFDIPIQISAPSSSGLINVSPNININANILSKETQLGGSQQQSSVITKRICIPIPKPPTTPKPSTPPTPSPKPSTRPPTSPPPERRCYRKICKNWQHSGGYKCITKPEPCPEYKIIYEH